MPHPSAEEPGFSPEGYASFLDALRTAGYVTAPVTAMPTRQTPTAHIRHDVDLHIEGILRIASIERQIGVSATYYVLMTGAYNPLFADNLAALREIVALGHEIGLHYDLQTWPQDITSAAAMLDLEVALLSAAINQPVRTIVRHQPSFGGGDPFRSHPRYINAHDPAYEPGMRYLSDSCRLWRTEDVREILSGKCKADHLLLNTHPEAWLNGNITDPDAYVTQQLLPTATEPLNRYFLEAVAPVWRSRRAAHSKR